MLDIKFLAKHNVMDHSLLVIIETNPEWIEQEKKKLLKKETKTGKSLEE